MARHPDELLLQRQHLLTRIEAQRLQLAQDAEPIARLFDLQARAQGAVDQAKLLLLRHPLAALGAVAAVAALKPRLSMRLAQRALVAWRTWRSVRRLLPASLFGSHSH